VDAELAKQLRALGADPQKCLRTNDDAVYDALEKHWKAHKLCPSINTLAQTLSLSRCVVRDGLARLVQAGRVLHPKRGVYVPRVAG